MKTILLEMSEGIGNAVQIMIIIAVILIPVSLSIYKIFLHRKIRNSVSTFCTIGITILLSMIILYLVSVIKDAEPFESLFDLQLIKLALTMSSFSILLVLTLSIYRLFKAR